MTFIQAIILGIVQGLTEFLPISSSAHLVLIPHFAGWNIPESISFSFDVIIQLGTLTAVILYFWHDLIAILKAVWAGILKRDLFHEPSASLGWLLVLATLPGIASGLLFKDIVENAFSNPILTAFFLFGTAFLLVVAEFIGKRRREMASLKWYEAIWIGLFQAISIFPGISRSGSTISGAMVCNFKRKDASKFSFLMAIPIMLGAGAVSIIDLYQTTEFTDSFLPIAVGFISAAITGYLAIRWLIKYISHHSFLLFAAYCTLLGVTTLVFALMNPERIAQKIPQAQDTDIRVGFSSDLQPLTSITQICTVETGQRSLIIFREDNNMKDIIELDARISYSPDEDSLPFQYIIASDFLYFTVNTQNPLISLSDSIVKKIFMGEYSLWGEIENECPACFSDTLIPDWKEKPIAVWIYPEGNIFQDRLREQYLGNAFLPSSAMIAPGPLEMLQALLINPTGIGFIPASWSNPALKQIPLSDSANHQMMVNVFAQTRKTADGSLKNWLLCIQNKFLEVLAKEGGK